MSRVLGRSTLRALYQSQQRTCLRPQASIASTRTILPIKIRCHSTSSTNGSSVSASEVSHFTKLASSWWDPHGPSRLLHLMNPLRHDFIQSCLATSEVKRQEKDQYTFLDIGCGGGIFASSAARLPSTKAVVAIDPTPEVIVVAERHKRSDPLLSKSGRLTYLNCAIEDLTAEISKQGSQEKEQEQEQSTLPITPQFDFVTIFEVIEHIDRPAEFLRTCLTHLRPGGWLIGSTIARHEISYLTTKLIGEAPWPIGVVPRGTHDWDKYINPSELRQWFKKENRLGNEVTDSDKHENTSDVYGKAHIEGCIYLPVMGWRFVNGSEEFGNYFFGVQKLR